MIEADAARDLYDVGTDELADVRDLVDEADARRKEGIRRELHELRGRDVGAHEHGFDPAVQLDDTIGVRVVKCTDDDPVRASEVLHRSTLGEELRIRDVPDALETARIEAGTYVHPGADGHGALHHDDGKLRQVGRKLVDHRPDRGEIGVAPVSYTHL